MATCDVMLSKGSGADLKRSSISFSVANFVFCCRLKVPLCLAPDCNNSSERDRERGLPFLNLPVKKRELRKEVAQGASPFKERFGAAKETSN